jgi:hypothetical protein
MKNISLGVCKNNLHPNVLMNGKIKQILNQLLLIVYLLSVYVCTFDARQHVVFINKLFEFAFPYLKKNNIQL